MSTFLKTLSRDLDSDQPNDAIAFAVEHFRQSTQPWEDFFNCLSSASQSKSVNINLIQCIIYSFGEWRRRFASAISEPLFNDSLFLYQLPISVLREFYSIFHLNEQYLVSLLRTAFTYPINSPSYKRLLTIIVTFDLQLHFDVGEILLPLILNNKDHLIHLYLNGKVNLQEYLLDLLNHLYDNGGQHLRRILDRDFGIRDQHSINKKGMKKLAIRFWKIFGNQQNDRYSNLATLQDRSAIGYLIGLKYSPISNENTMSEDCWIEAVEVRSYRFNSRIASMKRIFNVYFKDMIKDNQEIAGYLLELLTEKDDLIAVNYWCE
jgi:hypothetical protein